ncbi:LysR family transcriptional regulator [Vibrio sp. J1-1]|uniref:LysR family transcriptional regulator n=1 Tax=Vibrio sp. J1-1 TaxID=2912251 RepID=UPI001F360BA5|nr:LysR family transcriptional regulator [Vibrionaceae bacterium]MCF7480474.1 LysR family transcriptional regulator [Vibrio sp. J1-1]
MNLAQVDLNLLFILKNLLEEKHVSNTAVLLNMSQPSVSRSLQKLRSLFSDELLVRTAHGYELTPKAEVIKQDLTSVLTGLEKLMYGQSFVPEKSKGTIRFYGLVPQVMMLLPSVISRIREEAPNMIVDIDSIPKRHFDALITGDVHFVLSTASPPSSEQNLYRMKVASRDYRFLMSESHPLAHVEELTIDMLLECNFGQISLQGGKTLSIYHRFAELGVVDKNRRLSIPIQLSNFNAAPAIAEQTDVIFHLPTPFAEGACLGRQLITKTVPKEIRLDSESVYLYWHKRYHNDPMCSWVKSLFKEIYGSVEGE